MKDDVTARSQKAHSTVDADVSKKRRKVLKGAGVAAAAGAVWHKPVLDSVVVPAHAQTTVEPIMLAGSTGTTGEMGMNGLNQNKSMLAKVADAIIPPVNATPVEAVDVIQYNCSALINSGDDDYTHCISIALPEGDNPNGAFTLDLAGPDIYYDRIWRCQDYETTPYTVYYEGTMNLSGMSAGTLADRCIDVTVDVAAGSVIIKGEINEDFTAASGTIGLDTSLQGFNTGYGYCDNVSSEYGAFWSVDLTGGSCSIGSGVSTEYNVSTDYLSYCGG